MYSVFQMVGTTACFPAAHTTVHYLLQDITYYKNDPAPLAMVFGVLGCPAKSFFLSFILSNSQYAGKQFKFVVDRDFKCPVRVRVIYTYKITVGSEIYSVGYLGLHLRLCFSDPDS